MLGPYLLLSLAGAILGLAGSVSAIPSPKDENVRFRQPLCLLPEGNIPDCLLSLQKYDASGNKVGEMLRTNEAPTERPRKTLVSTEVRQHVDLEDLEASGLEITRYEVVESAGSGSGARSRRALGTATTKVLDSPVAVTIVAHNCYPRIGVPLCDGYESDERYQDSGNDEQSMDQEFSLYEKFASIGFGPSAFEGLDDAVYFIEKVEPMNEEFIEQSDSSVVAAENSLHDRTESVGYVSPRSKKLVSKRAVPNFADDPDNVSINERENAARKLTDGKSAMNLQFSRDELNNVFNSIIQTIKQLVMEEQETKTEEPVTVNEQAAPLKEKPLIANDETTTVKAVPHQIDQEIPIMNQVVESFSRQTTTIQQNSESSTETTTVEYKPTTESTIVAPEVMALMSEDTTIVNEESTTMIEEIVTFNRMENIEEETTPQTEEMTTMSEEKTIINKEKATMNEETVTMREEATTIGEEMTTMSAETTTASEEATTMGEEMTTMIFGTTGVTEETTTMGEEMATINENAAMMNYEVTTEDIELTTENEEATAVDDDMVIGNDEITTTTEEASVTPEITTVSDMMNEEEAIVNRVDATMDYESTGVTDSKLMINEDVANVDEESVTAAEETTTMSNYAQYMNEQVTPVTEEMTTTEEILSTSIETTTEVASKTTVVNELTTVTDKVTFTNEEILNINEEATTTREETTAAAEIVTSTPVGTTANILEVEKENATTPSNVLRTEIAMKEQVIDVRKETTMAPNVEVKEELFKIGNDNDGNSIQILKDQEMNKKYLNFLAQLFKIANESFFKSDNQYKDPGNGTSTETIFPNVNMLNVFIGPNYGAVIKANNKETMFHPEKPTGRKRSRQNRKVKRSRV